VAALAVAACGNDRIVSDSSSTENATKSAMSTTSSTTAPLVTTSSVVGTDGATDRADAYLGATTEIYRRRLPDGQNFVVRLSTQSYATVFGLTWTAPTGSADMCLGDHAVFLGVPGDIGPWGSAWVASAWFDDPKPTQPAVLQSSMWAAENTVPATEFLVVRVDADAAEIVLAASDGTELDRALVVNAIAMVVVDPRAKGAGETVNDLSVMVVAKDGQQSALTPLAPPGHKAPPDCGPGEPPQRPLPASGAQPADPDTAAAQIRQRHSLLVDRSVPAEGKPADLLNDDTGVQSAIAKMDAGPYRDIASTAAYSIDDLVFTRPDEAWFRYTITTSSSTFGDPPTVEPPMNPEWAAAWREWVGRAMLYTGNDGCPPLSQC